MPAKRQRNSTKRWKRTLTSSRRAVRAAAAAQDPIQHVVLLILENRSFDHMLGCMEKEIAEIDGVLANGAARENFDPEGRRYPQQAGAAREVERDPMHEKDNVLEQIKTHNDGFVRDYAQHYPRRRLRSARRSWPTTTSARCQRCTSSPAISPSAISGIARCRARRGPTGCSP